MTKTSKELEEALTTEIHTLSLLKGKNLPEATVVGTKLLSVILNHTPSIPGHYNPKIKRMVGAGEDSVYNKIWPQVLTLNNKNVAYSTKYVDGRSIVGIARIMNFIDYCLGK